MGYYLVLKYMTLEEAVTSPAVSILVEDTILFVVDIAVLIENIISLVPNVIFVKMIGNV